MSLKAIFAFVCATAVCAAQSNTVPQAPAQPAIAAAAKEAPAPSTSTIPPAASPQNSTTQNSAAEPGAAQTAAPPAAQDGASSATPSGDTKQAPAVTTAPVLDVPPARKSAGTGKKPAVTGNTSGAGTAGKAELPYVIGPLDVLVVKVWGQTNLSGPVNVDADGTISMPLINEVKADGLTKEQLKAELTKRFSDFLNNPEVDVQVAKINSKTYFVYGGVGRPGEVQLVKPTTIMDALSGVGGFRDFANTKKIYILRTLPSGETQKFNFNYKDVSKGKNMEQNIYLQNGDRIFVPE
jgi:polysaccharide biosynthesis/export protein